MHTFRNRNQYRSGWRINRFNTRTHAQLSTETRKDLQRAELALDLDDAHCYSVLERERTESKSGLASPTFYLPDWTIILFFVEMFRTLTDLRQ